VSPDLQAAARQIKADLYIAHNVGALTAAFTAAQRHGARLGFDAEDFHSGMSPQMGPPSLETLLTERIEESILPQCDYVTAAAPLISERYALKYSIPMPRTIFNVFSLSERRAPFRESRRDGAVTLCWFSQTIGANRGLEDVVRAMGLIKEYEIELHLLGDWQPGYRDDLFRLVEAAGLAPSRIKIHCPVRPDDVVSWAVEYDIGLAVEQPQSLNRNICLTNKIFTYLLAGNAIIATATAGQTKLMSEISGSGFAYTPGDVNHLAAHLRFLCSDRAALNVARRRAWDYGTQKFNWDLEKSKLLDIVESVLRQPARRVA
jgi:glycosyltransferase involved in cell wall biosynthesis